MESPILEKLFQAEMAGMIFMEYFDIALKFETITAGSTPDQAGQVPQEADFLIRIINRSAFTGGNYQENPNLLLSIVDSGAGRLFNTAIVPHITTVTGTGQRPFIL